MLLLNYQLQFWTFQVAMLGGSLTLGCGWRNGLQLWIYWIRSRGQTTRGGPPAWRLDVELTTPHRKKKLVTKTSKALGRPTCRWVDNIKMDLGEVDWIGLAQDRNRWRAVVNSVLNLWVPWNAGKLSSGLTSSGLSISVQLHIVS
jgi:hypothetical protein